VYFVGSIINSRVSDLKCTSRVNFSGFYGTRFSSDGSFGSYMEDVCLDFSEECADSIFMMTAVILLGAEAST
jgi:hypothetical protein